MQRAAANIEPDRVINEHRAEALASEKEGTGALQTLKQLQRPEQPAESGALLQVPEHLKKLVNR